MMKSGFPGYPARVSGLAAYYFLLDFALYTSTFSGASVDSVFLGDRSLRRPVGFSRSRG
jgi:hypothetical protein